MQTPLDQEEIHPIQVKDIFAKISFTCIMLTIGLIFYLLYTSIRIRAAEVDSWPGYLAYYLHGSGIVGFVTIIISLVRREQRSIWKIMAILLNLLLVLFIVGLVLFALYA